MATDAQVDNAADAIRGMVAEIARLSGADIPRQAFFKEFLVRTVRAIDAQGGAVWIGRDGRFNLIADVHLASSQFTTNDRQHDGIRAALRWTQEHRRSLIIAPMGPEEADDPDASGIANTTTMPFFYVPIRTAEKVVGVLQVWQKPGRDPKHFRAFAEFLIQVTLYAESFLESRQLDTVVRETQRLEQLLLVTERVSASETADQLATEVANLGRDLVSADRLTVLSSSDGTPCRVLATSGQRKTERRSPLVRVIEGLARVTLDVGDARAFRRPTGEAETSPEVDRYFAVSTLDMVVVMPLRHGDTTAGALAAEYAVAEKRPSDEDLAALESLARQIGPALARRSESQRLPLRRTARLLASLSPARGLRRPMVLVALLAAVLLAAVVPVSTDIDGRCTVWPARRAVVVAHEAGRVAKVLVGEGDRVTRGQPLVRLASPTLAAELAKARQEVGRWEAETQRCEAADDPSAAQIARNRRAKAEGQVAYLEARVAALMLVAPIDGTVVTRDPASRLGDELSRGELMLKVADLDRWELVIEVSERDIASLEQALDDAGAGGRSSVEFLLASQRQDTLRAEVTSRDEISPVARPVAGRNVFLVRVPIAEEQLSGVELRVGYEGRARIAGPRKSLLRAAVDPLINYLQMAMF